MKKFLLVLGLVVLLGVAWWLGSPLFLNKVVDEDLPEGLVGIEKAVTLDEFDEMLGMPSKEEMEAMGQEEMESMKEEMEKKAAEMPDVVVDELMEMSKGTPESVGVAEPVEPSEVEASGSKILAKGQFVDGDNFHKGSGDVFLFELEDGSHVLRLENFEVTNGPDLFVYLTKKAGAKSSEEVHEGFFDAGRLKGNKGNQNYVIPADVDVSDFGGVVIYCRAFSVLFSSAEF